MSDFRQKQKDFLEFLQSQAEQPPEVLDHAISAEMKRRLRIEGPRTVTKFISCHLFAAVLTLMICPQFGLGSVFCGSISHYFMSIGAWACALYCSVIFFGIGFLASKLTLNLTEARRLAIAPWYLAIAYCAGILILFLLVGNRSSEHLMFFQLDYIAVWWLSGVMILVFGLRMGGSSPRRLQASAY